MARNIIKADQLRKRSGAYKELFNEDGLQVYALNNGRLEVTCGSTHTIAHSLQEVSDKINELPLHNFPRTGSDVLNAIQAKLGSQYRLEVRSSTDNGDKLLHTVEGSRQHITESMRTLISTDISNMDVGRRYSAEDNIYGGDYVILVPMNSVGLEELSPSFTPNKLYENQNFIKGQVVVGIEPTTGEPFEVYVEESYPNGTFKTRVYENEFRIYGHDDIEAYQFVAKQQCIPTEQEDFRDPDMSMYESSDIPSYNPTGDVLKSAPMLNDLTNYDIIMSSSASILNEFMKTAKKVAQLDHSSLNKITVSSIDDSGNAVEGAIEWNVRLSSPFYRRSSLVTIPMTMVAGNMELGREFITSTGQRIPLTVEAIHEHLGTLADDDFANSRFGSVYPSTMKANRDIDALLDGVEAVKKLAFNQDYVDMLNVWQQEQNSFENISIDDVMTLDGDVLEWRFYSDYDNPVTKKFRVADGKIVEELNSTASKKTADADGTGKSPDIAEVVEDIIEMDKPLDNIPGGKSEGMPPSEFDEEQLEMGTEVEMEHTDDPEIAAEITMDHQAEGDAFNEEYYDELAELEDELKAEDAGEPSDEDVEDIIPEDEDTEEEDEEEEPKSNPFGKRESKTAIRLAKKMAELKQDNDSFDALAGAVPVIPPSRASVHAAAQKKLIADIDADYMASKKTASDFREFQEIVEQAESKEDAVAKLKEMGWESPFTPNTQDTPETIEEAVDRLYDQTQEQKGYRKEHQDMLSKTRNAAELYNIPELIKEIRTVVGDSTYEDNERGEYMLDTISGGAQGIYQLKDAMEFFNVEGLDPEDLENWEVVEEVAGNVAIELNAALPEDLIGPYFYFGHNDNGDYGLMVGWDPGVDTDTTAAKKTAMGLSVPQKHQKKIALDTLKMSDAGASIMGGMTKEEARKFLRTIGYSDDKIAQIEKEGSKKTAAEDKLLLEYDPNNSIDDEVKYMMENPGDFDYIDDLDFTDEDAVREYVYSDSERNTFIWEDVKESMTALLEERGKASDYMWDISGSNLGWQNRSGEKVVQIETFKDLTEKVFPDTDYIFKVYDVDGKSFYITLYHHDSPTGESYHFSPLEPIPNGTKVKLLDVTGYQQQDGLKIGDVGTITDYEGAFDDSSLAYRVEFEVTDEDGDIVHYDDTFSSDVIEVETPGVGASKETDVSYPPEYESVREWNERNVINAEAGKKKASNKTAEDNSTETLKVWVGLNSEDGLGRKVLVGLDEEGDAEAFIEVIETYTDYTVASLDYFGDGTQEEMVQQYGPFVNVIVGGHYNADVAEDALSALYPRKRGRSSKKAAAALKDVYDVDTIMASLRTAMKDPTNTAPGGAAAVISVLGQGEDRYVQAGKVLDVEATKEAVLAHGDTIANDLNMSVPADLKTADVEFFVDDSGSAVELIATWTPPEYRTGSKKRAEKPKTETVKGDGRLSDPKNSERTQTRTQPKDFKGGNDIISDGNTKTLNTGKSAAKKAALPSGSGASVDYDEENGTVSLHQPGWYSPDLSPPAGYSVAKKYYGNWEEFKQELGITKMAPVEFNDKYFIIIGGRGGSDSMQNNFYDDLDEDISYLIGEMTADMDVPEEEITDLIDETRDNIIYGENSVSYDDVEDALIERVWGNVFKTEDPNEVGAIIDSADWEDKGVFVMETMQEVMNEMINVSSAVEKTLEGKEFPERESTKMRKMEEEGQQVIPGMERGTDASKKTGELLSEQNTPEMKQRILNAFNTSPYAANVNDVTAEFDDLMWWIVGYTGDGDELIQYAVEDAEGPGSYDGFDFEQV